MRRAKGGVARAIVGRSVGKGPLALRVGPSRKEGDEKVGIAGIGITASGVTFGAATVVGPKEECRA